MERLRVRASWIACVVALAISACGSDDEAGSGPMDGAAGEAATGGSGGSGAAPATSDAERFLADYAAAVCAMYEPCCEDEALGFSASGCRDWFARVTKVYFSGEFLPEQGEQCLSAIEQALGDDPERCRSIGSFDEATLRDTCREAFGLPERTGSELGGTCLLAADCASSEEGPVICSSGHCLLQLRGAEGDGPCAMPGDPPNVSVRCEAEDGLYCHRGDNVCRPTVGDGELCPYAGACNDTAMCVGGTCRRFPEPGEPCLNGIPGAGGFCAPRSVCDRVELTCRAGLENGAPCAQPDECASGICPDGRCEYSDFTRSLNCTG